MSRSVGSLPGIAIGDSFVDTNGFCWYASAGTSAPVTGLVYVDTSYTGEECGFCTDSNPCPTIYVLQQCCSGVQMYVTAASLGYTPTTGDIIVDTFGLCWNVKDVTGGVANIATSIVYASTDNNVGDCEACLANNPCPDKYDTWFFTVRNCCTGDSEVVQGPWYLIDAGQNGIFSASQIATPYVFECWELFSWSTTGTATVTIENFGGVQASCEDCKSKFPCPDFYEVEDCCGLQSNQVVYANVGYGTEVYLDNSNVCWKTVGPNPGPATITLGSGGNYGTCENCTANFPCPG